MNYRILLLFILSLIQTTAFANAQIKTDSVINTASNCVMSQINDSLRLVDSKPSIKSLKAKKSDMKKVDAFAKRLNVDYEKCGFHISKEMQIQYPGLVFLIIKSQMLESDQEKQFWFDLYTRMTKKQIVKVYKLRINEQRREEYKKITKETIEEKSVAVADTLCTHCILSQIKHDFRFLNKPLHSKNIVNTCDSSDIKAVDIYMVSLNIDYSKCDFKITKDMITNHPGLIYLILKSSAFSNDTEKQECFDLYSLLNNAQIINLYNILIKEHKQSEYAKVKSLWKI